MRVSQDGIDLIKKWEGIEDGDPTTSNLDPYICPAGYWTIGWGHVVRDSNQQMLKGRAAGSVARAIYPRGISMEEAETLLRDDLRSFDFEMRRSLRDAPATQWQYDALIALAFNIGGTAFNQSTVLRMHRAGQCSSALPIALAVIQIVDQGRAPANAADAFLMWNKITDPKSGAKVNSKGLTNRRSEERALYLKVV